MAGGQLADVLEGDVGGVIGAAVVNDDDLIRKGRIELRPAPEILQRLVHHLREADLLIVGRDDDGELCLGGGEYRREWNRRPLGSVGSRKVVSELAGSGSGVMSKSAAAALSISGGCLRFSGMYR